MWEIYSPRKPATGVSKEGEGGGCGLRRATVTRRPLAIEVTTPRTKGIRTVVVPRTKRGSGTTTTTTTRKTKTDARD